MNSCQIKPKEATSIINSLVSGVVPKTGLQHITVGRSGEIEAFIKALEDVRSGQSIMKFWIGEFGSGKSFMLHLMNTVALKQKFIVASADFTPDTRLYSNDGKSVALYKEIMNNLSIQTKPEGGALPILLEKWIEYILVKTAQEKQIPLDQIRDIQYANYISRNINSLINNISNVGGFDFGLVVQKYYEGYLLDDEEMKKNCLKWLKGEYTTKTEAKRDLGVREIIDDQNYYDMLKNFSGFFTSIGYNGLVINLDEAINLYKISIPSVREKNYEKLLTIYNDCFQGRVTNIMFNIAGTNAVLENERRGFYSYRALKTRLETNKYETTLIRDFSQPVIRLFPLSHNEIFVLLNKLLNIFDFHYNCQSNIETEDIRKFMEEIYNKPGANEFLTPREVIRDFLNILNILRQNPNLDKKALFSKIIITDERDDNQVEEL